MLLRPTAWALLASVVATGFATPAVAQDDVEDGPGAVVQTIPNNDSMNLNAALARLGQNPRDVSALIDAGNAALTIGDVDASIGFFSRADQVSPGNTRVKSGLAAALVRNGNPFDAIPMFDAAERGGGVDSRVIPDRGLAYDLVGDNATAQRYYRQALAAGPNDEALRRLAISLAIAGDKRGSAATLTPMLARQDKAAWRTRAFALAILGQPEDAVAVVNSTLPTSLATSIAPYLRYMSRLTPAQQAGAANFGQFPRASEIGRDDPRVARYAPATPRRPALATVDAGLIPKGEPLGKRGRDRDRDRRAPVPEIGVAAQPAATLASADDARKRRDPRKPPPEVQPQRASAPQPLLTTPGPATPLPAPSIALAPAPVAAVPAAPVRPPVAISAATPVPAPTSRPLAPGSQLAATMAAQAPVAAPAGPSPVAAPVVAMVPPASTAPVTPTAAPGFVLSGPPTSYSLPPSPVPSAAAPAPVPILAAPAPTPAAAAPLPAPAIAPAVVPAPAPVVAPAPPRKQSLAEAFSDLAQPTVDVTPTAGAVDVRRIKPARVASSDAATSKAAPVPSHPSRIWVQLGIGRDRKALGFDWRRMARQADTLFKGRKAQTSVWSQTNRLLAGPFESEAAANSFVSQLRRADIAGSFVWTSPAGQVVDELAVK